MTKRKCKRQSENLRLHGSQQGGNTNRLPSCSSSHHFLCSSLPLLGVLGVRDGSGIHWASTVRAEAEDGTPPCAGAAPPAAAGEAGGDGCGWPWPWELVRWRRHLKEPAWVGGAHTHLPPPWLWLWLPEDADERLRRMVRGDDAAAPVGVVLALWWWWCGPWNLPSSPVVST